MAKYIIVCHLPLAFDNCRLFVFAVSFFTFSVGSSLIWTFSIFDAASDIDLSCVVDVDDFGPKNEAMEDEAFACCPLADALAIGWCFFGLIFGLVFSSLTFTSFELFAELLSFFPSFVDCGFDCAAPNMLVGFFTTVGSFFTGGGTTILFTAILRFSLFIFNAMLFGGGGENWEPWDTFKCPTNFKRYTYYLFADGSGMFRLLPLTLPISRLYNVCVWFGQISATFDKLFSETTYAN